VSEYDYLGGRPHVMSVLGRHLRLLSIAIYYFSFNQTWLRRSEDLGILGAGPFAYGCLPFQTAASEHLESEASERF